MDIRELKECSVESSQITFLTQKFITTSKCINPYEPFKGVDGNTYLIEYDSKLNSYTNCYAFAIGWRVPAQNKYDDYVPGFLAGKPYSLENSASLVKADLEKVDRKVYEILFNIPKELPEGDGYWIKFLCNPTKGELSAHFMRKDKKSGRWLHKMGWKKPPSVCEMGEITEYKAMWAMRISEP